MNFRELPGSELILEGIDSLRNREMTIAALLVLIGAARLRAAGVEVPECDIDSPELRLYEKLAETDPDSAHSRYNALIRQLVSFERAAECAG